MQDDYKVVYIHREKAKWIPIEEKPTEMASMYLITGKFADGEEFLHPINEHPQKASISYKRLGGHVGYYMVVPTPPPCSQVS